MLVPNADRVILKNLDAADTSQTIIVPGKLKAGENLYAGEVVHAGSTAFKSGQIVYYSEYSASAILELGGVAKGTMSLGDAYSSEQLYVVASDDIMAWEE